MKDLFLNKENKKGKWTNIPTHPARLKVLKTKNYHPQEHQFSAIKISGTITWNPSPSLPVVPHSYLPLLSSEF